ncbi:Clavaminate synthase-like protein [Xylariaceae sp. FL0594]|nr:Clavaminate synthase-like protein [Xylariaceae sp. FL0594]
MGTIQVAGPVVAPGLGNVSLQVPEHAPHAQDRLADLPRGYPSRINHPFAWTGADFVGEASYVYRLTLVDKMELHQAKDHFKAQELDGNLVSQENFPLPTLGVKLRAISVDIHSGKGFHVIRGLDPDDYSVEDLTIIWLGVQSYIADQFGRQDDRGNMLVHIVADNSTETKLGHHRHSTSAISFHNEEAGDVVSWLTRSTSKTGGRCILAPVYTIYNILAAHRPDVIRTLTKSDWPVALPRFHCRPLMFYHEGRLMMNFGRTPLLGSAAHPRPSHLPQLSERQREALDLVEAIAQAVQVEIQTRSGDMHLINNLTVLHRREGFVDGALPGEKRHLVRMRLRRSSPRQDESQSQGQDQDQDDGCPWPIPEPLRQEWSDAFDEQGPKAWHLEPMPGDAFPLRKYTN